MAITTCDNLINAKGLKTSFRFLNGDHFVFNHPAQAKQRQGQCAEPLKTLRISEHNSRSRPHWLS